MILPGSRIRANGIFGTITDNPLTAGSNNFSSAELADLTTIAGDHAIITFDPLKQYGDPELVLVTAHGAAGVTATVSRGMFGSAARGHPEGTLWAHAATNDDFTRVVTSGTQPADPYESQMIYETDTASYKTFNGADWVDLGASAGGFPVAMIVPTGAAAAPSGWLMCEGAEVLGTTYPALAAELGTGAGSRFGAATAGNIKLPDLRRAFPMGKAASGTGSTLAGTGGSKDAAQVSHGHTVDSHSHGGTATTTGSSHSHNVTLDLYASNDVHSHGNPFGEFGIAAKPTLGPAQGGYVYNIGPGGTHTHEIPGDSPGTNTVGVPPTDLNLPPWLAVNYMIKAH